MNDDDLGAQDDDDDDELEKIEELEP